MPDYASDYASRGWSGAGVGVGMLRVLEIPLLENEKGLLISWFIGFRFSFVWFLGFLVYICYILPNIHFMLFIDVDPISKIFKKTYQTDRRDFSVPAFSKISNFWISNILIFF